MLRVFKIGTFIDYTGSDAGTTRRHNSLVIFSLPPHWFCSGTSALNRVNLFVYSVEALSNNNNLTRHFSFSLSS